jgi:hypothetical protein
MTWNAQVRHVVAKDLRESWKLGVLYVITVLVSVAVSLGWVGLGVSLNFIPLLVGIVGALLAAAVVQSDSPTRANAFWASHPFSPSAMAASKLAIALLIVLLGAAGQLVAVQPFQVHGAELAHAVLRPACFFAALLTGAMLLAAVTTDLRSWLLSVIALPISILLVTLMLYRLSLPDLARESMLAFLGAGALAVFAWLYRSREQRQRSRIAAFGVVALAMFVTGANSPAPSTRAPATTAAAAAVPLSIERWRVGDHDPLALALDLTVGGIPLDERRVLRNPGVTVVLRDGRTLPLAARGNILTTSSTGDSTTYLELGKGLEGTLPRMAGITYRLVPPPTVRIVQLSARMTPDQRRAVDGGVAGIVLDGTVVVLQGHVLSTMPLRVGSTLVDHGRRLRIEKWTAEFGSPELVVHSNSLETERSTDPVFGLMNSGEVVLVSPTRHEAIGLQRQSSASTLDGLVLPSSFLTAEVGHYEVYPNSSAVLPDADWYRGARLLLVKQDLVGSYPLRVEMKMP